MKGWEGDGMDWHGVSWVDMKWVAENEQERRNGVEWMGGMGWNGVERNSAGLESTEWNGWVWKESDETAWDDEKEWEEMKGDEMVWGRTALNGTERRGTEWAGAKWTER